MQTAARDLFDRHCRRAAPAAPPWTWRSVLTAAGVTALTFVLLPYLQALSNQPARRRLIRDVATTRLAPPPAVLPIEIRPPTPPANPNLPKPRLTQDRQTIPVKAMLDVNLAIPGLQVGDFAMDFAVASTNLLREIGDPVFEIADVDQPPQPLIQIRPVYPTRAQLRRLEGRVTIEFVVTAEGNTTQIKVLECMPDELFAQAAVRAAQRWHFKPATRDRQPVAVRVRQTIRFQMEE